MCRGIKGSVRSLIEKEKYWLLYFYVCSSPVVAWTQLCTPVEYVGDGVHTGGSEGYELASFSQGVI